MAYLLEQPTSHAQEEDTRSEGSDLVILIPLTEKLSITRLKKGVGEIITLKRVQPLLM